MDLGLGRLPAPDDRHLRRWSLEEEFFPAKPTPVVVGTNWYEGFDPAPYGGSLRQDTRGRWWFPPAASWGQVRGGHAWLLVPPGVQDTTGWWEFYDQGREGACVGFSSCRMQTLQNRLRYDGQELYQQARRQDDWPGEDYSGTSVRAGMDVLRQRGPRQAYRGASRPPDPAHGIEANRWVRRVEDVARCLSPADEGRKVLDRGYVAMLNSWGRSYPHLAYLTLEQLARLLFAEDGEGTVVTDR